MTNRGIPAYVGAGSCVAGDFVILARGMGSGANGSGFMAADNLLNRFSLIGVD